MDEVKDVTELVRSIGVQLRGHASLGESKSGELQQCVVAVQPALKESMQRGTRLPGGIDHAGVRGYGGVPSAPPGGAAGTPQKWIDCVEEND
jgi:hypothetical protein